MASTFTITATAQPTATPPRVKLAIGQTGTPALSQVTVNRTDAAGNTFPVRSPDGDVVTVSGGSAVVYDNEAPFGQTLTYTVAANNAPTATTELDVTQVWLVHLGVPRRSCPIEFPSGAAGDSVRAMPRGVFQILGSSWPIVISGGARTAPAQTLTVLTETLTDLAALQAVLADGAPLLLNVPPSLGYGLDTNYISVGDVPEKRGVPLATSPLRTVDLPYQVVGRPAGSAQAAVMWSDLTYASYSAIPAGTTYTDLAG